MKDTLTILITYGQPIKFRRTHLTPIAQVVMLIIAHNIKPQSLLSHINFDLYYKVTACVIDEEMRGIVQSGDNRPVAFLGLIMRLCNAVGIFIPNNMLKINRSYIHNEDVSRMCMIAAAGSGTP